MNLRRDRRAIGGFLEEICAFTVVVLAVALFLVTAYNTFCGVARDRELGALQDDCQRFARAFRSYDRVLETGAVSGEPQIGVLDGSKLDDLNLSVLERDLNSPHSFNVTIRDLATNQSWSFSRTPVSQGPVRACYVCAVVTTTDEGRRDPGRLEVVVWQ